MDDDSLETQMNQAKQNLPARLTDIYGEEPRADQTGPDLRSATAEPTSGKDNQSKARKSEVSRRDRRYSQPDHTLKVQARKLGQALKGATLSANDLGRENLDSASQEINTEVADAAFAGTNGFVRGLRAGLDAYKDNQKRSGEIVPADPKAIEDFIAQLPPPPKAIAPPLKRLPSPTRYQGPERD